MAANIGIVGGGAIGLLHAAKLALSGCRVTVWTRTESQASFIQSEGVELVRDGQFYRVRMDGRWIEADAGQLEAESQAYDWLLLTVKQSHIDDELLRNLRELAGESTPVLCLQNGIGHMEKLELSLPGAPLFAGVTSEGAKKLGPASVEHTGSGTLYFGAWTGSKTEKTGQMGENRQNLLINALKLAGFSAFLSNEIKDRIYQKLLTNAVINPLTALYDIPNGLLPQHSGRLKLMRSLYEESAAILAADGMVPDENGWNRILSVCEATSSNISSMLADVRAGRTTEIDWINGGLSAIAQRNGIRSSLNDAMTAIVKAMGST
ncbi:ketopantoate reductase family protein [Paenibacillus sp. NPDC058071]|uniref:ketopantoate reductase family protein n=1 Tax=Paenibacillus sp. NPDC058071 TaxID=3346326 RepID=UPI0036DC7C76